MLTVFKQELAGYPGKIPLVRIGGLGILCPVQRANAYAVDLLVARRNRRARQASRARFWRGPGRGVVPRRIGGRAAQYSGGTQQARPTARLFDCRCHSDGAGCLRLLHEAVPHPADGCVGDSYGQALSETANAGAKTLFILMALAVGVGFPNLITRKESAKEIRIGRRRRIL